MTIPEATIEVTIYQWKNGRMGVAVKGATHDRKNMLIIAAALRREAELIEVRDAE
jgi:hypothetical protein